MEMPLDVTLNDINAVILIANEFGEIIFANKRVYEVYKLEPEQVMGVGWWKSTSDNEEEAITRQTDLGRLARGELDLKPFNLLERPFTTSENKVVWTQWTNSRVSGNRIMGVAQDITEKKDLEFKLIRKNHENEVLLQEVYHRVKNNLQLISSFLNLEFGSVVDRKALSALKKTKTRIHTMSLIHAQLCESAITKKEFADFFDELLDYISSIYASDKRINIFSKFDSFHINTELLVNIGLIITELVSNAVRHAFDHKISGNINVQLVRYGATQKMLLIKDDGCGFPSNLIEQNSLGFDIVISLVEQIEGEMAFSFDQGTEIKIIF